LYESLPRPDLLIYLKAPLNVLVTGYENVPEYGNRHNAGVPNPPRFHSMTNELNAFDMCPVLTIRSDDLDFCSSAKAFGDSGGEDPGQAGRQRNNATEQLISLFL